MSNPTRLELTQLVVEELQRRALTVDEIEAITNEKVSSTLSRAREHVIPELSLAIVYDREADVYRATADPNAVLAWVDYRIQRVATQLDRIQHSLTIIDDKVIPEAMRDRIRTALVHLRDVEADIDLRESGGAA